MGSCFPELTMWNRNLRDTTYSSDGAKHSLSLKPHSCLSYDYSWLKRRVESACEVKSGNKSISGHLTRTQMTKTHEAAPLNFLQSPFKWPQPLPTRAGSSSHVSQTSKTWQDHRNRKSSWLFKLAVPHLCTIIYFADTSKQTGETSNKHHAWNEKHSVFLAYSPIFF